MCTYVHKCVHMCTTVTAATCTDVYGYIYTHMKNEASVLEPCLVPQNLKNQKKGHPSPPHECRKYKKGKKNFFYKFLDARLTITFIHNYVYPHIDMSTSQPHIHTYVQPLYTIMYIYLHNILCNHLFTRGLFSSQCFFFFITYFVTVSPPLEYKTNLICYHSMVT